MAAKSRRTNPGLAERLFEEPHRFSFFQAVRLLEAIEYENQQAEAGVRRNSIGHDSFPNREQVRFGTLPSHGFAASEIVKLKPGQVDPEELSPSEMTITFLGLIGAAGVLPNHYTTTIIHQQRDKDHALARFLDLFHHRTISHFYRAWEKYRFPISYERTRLWNAQDFFAFCIQSLAGFGTAGLGGRQQIPNELYSFFSGHFAHRPRSVAALVQIISEYFGVHPTIEQFQGQWLHLEPDDQSRLPSPELPEGRNNQLGISMVVGDRVWDVQSKFRIQLGPLGFDEFQNYTPAGNGLRTICELVRSYVGPEFDFDIQPILRREEVPECQLTSAPDSGSRLGWTSWLQSTTPERDATEAVFFLADV